MTRVLQNLDVIMLLHHLTLRTFRILLVFLQLITNLPVYQNNNNKTKTAAGAATIQIKILYKYYINRTHSTAGEKEKETKEKTQYSI